MDKLLTISVAAYNVAGFIEKTLDSCVIPELLDQLEVIIEDDGATDNTAELAEVYCEKYPDTFRLIRKENGGYGSTVDRSIKEARGKYFKLLDGDDWFDRNGLIYLVSQLKEHDCDLHLNRYYYVKDVSFEQSLCEDLWNEYEGKELPVSDVHCELKLGIWHTTVKTDLLKILDYEMPKHTLYTDQLFLLRFMPYIKNIYFDRTPVYCYRIGRDGQSVSKDGLIKHYKEAVLVFKEGIRIRNAAKGEDPDTLRLMDTRISKNLYFTLEALLFLKRSKEHYKEVKELMDHCRENAPEVYEHSIKVSGRIRLLHRAGYLAYLILAGR